MQAESAYVAAERNVAQLNEITAIMTAGGYSVNREDLKTMLQQGTFRKIATGIPEKMNRKQRQRLLYCINEFINRRPHPNETFPFPAVATPQHYDGNGKPDLAPILVAESEASRHAFTHLMKRQSGEELVDAIEFQYRPNTGELSLKYRPSDPHRFQQMQRNSDDCHYDTLVELALAQDEQGTIRPAVRPRCGDSIVTRYGEVTCWRLTEHANTTDPKNPTAGLFQAFRYAVELLLRAAGADPQPAMDSMDYYRTGSGQIPRRPLHRLHYDIADLSRALEHGTGGNPALDCSSENPQPVYLPRYETTVPMHIYRIRPRYERIVMAWNSKNRQLTQTPYRSQHPPPLLRPPGSFIPETPSKLAVLDRNLATNAWTVQFGSKVPKYVKAAVLERSAPAQLDFSQSATTPAVISEPSQTMPVRETPGQRTRRQPIREADHWQARLGVAVADRLARGENP